MRRRSTARRSSPFGWYSDDLKLCRGEPLCVNTFIEAKSRPDAGPYYAEQMDVPPYTVLWALALEAQRGSSAGLRRVIAKHAMRVQSLGERLNATYGRTVLQPPTSYIDITDVYGQQASQVQAIEIPEVGAWVQPDTFAEAVSEATGSGWWIMGGAVAALAVISLAVLRG